MGGIYGSGGLTGVWAEHNTRESIYAALRRKETFASSACRALPAPRRRRRGRRGVRDASSLSG